MKKKTLFNKVLWTIVLQITEYTNYQPWIPKGKAMLALQNRWTGEYKYFYSMESILNWWAEIMK